MQSLFNNYGNFVDNGISVEDARFVLPYSYNSNIIMGLNGRELEKLVVSLLYGNLSKMSELKELGTHLYNIIKEYVPYLVDGIEEQEEKNENSFEYLENNVKRPKIEILDKAKLISYTPDADDTVIDSYIMYHYQCSKEQAKEIEKELEQKDKNYKEKIMDIILNKEERRELEQVSFTFQIPISLSILTHLTRHRMHSLLIPEFTPMWDLNNYVIPETIRNKGLDELYVSLFKKNMEVYEEFKKEDVLEEDLIYFYLGGQMCNVVTTMNARNVQWICRLRCCNKAQWQIRYIAKEMAKQVSNVAPLIGKGLGPTCITQHVCNEGRESCGLIDAILKKEKDN